MQINPDVTVAELKGKADRLFELSAAKLRAIAGAWRPEVGTPVFTVRGVYTAREWTEWTLGFLFGSGLLQFEATGDRWALVYGRAGTLAHMASRLTHTGVHDHGFNIVSAYGNLLRLAKEGKVEPSDAERSLYRLALQASGAVQAARWTRLADGRGFVHSFNGPHSLFIDTMRSLRSLALAHRLGQVLMGELDARISLLERLLHHALVTAEYSVYYGEGRDAYDVRGRVAHEAVFNVTSGTYRCPNSQQGWSPFSTWTRGLGWAMLGFAEELEFLAALDDAEFAPFGGRARIEGAFLRAAEATCEFYLANTPLDGIPYWDTGAPGLAKLSDYLARPSDPFNDQEPVDSSTAAIAAQGLWRLANYLRGAKGRAEDAKKYRQAALTIASTLFDEPYLSTGAAHQGLILHSVYHRPNGWDYVPPGRKIPCGEATMWGDYHARELALLILREARGESYPAFFTI